MAIRNLNKAKCKDEGDTNAVVCPSCGEETAMRLIKAEDSSFLPKLLDKPAEITFAVCPKCAAVFSVNKTYLDAKEAGTSVFAESSDFTPLNKSL